MRSLHLCALFSLIGARCHDLSRNKERFFQVIFNSIPTCSINGSSNSRNVDRSVRVCQPLSPFHLGQCFSPERPSPRFVSTSGAAGTFNIFRAFSWERSALALAAYDVLVHITISSKFIAHPSTIASLCLRYTSWTLLHPPIHATATRTRTGIICHPWRC